MPTRWQYWAGESEERIVTSAGRPGGGRFEAALAGLAAATAGVAAGQLAGAFTNPAAAPLVAVGSALIDLAPTPAKEWAVAVLGTADKPVLLVVVGLAVLALGALAGSLGRRRPAVGIGLLVGLGAVGFAAAIPRARGPFDLLPALAAGVVAVGLIWVQLRWLAAGRTLDTGAPIDRRVLVTAAAGLGAAAFAGAITGPLSTLRDTTTPTTPLPQPDQAPAPLPAGLEAAHPGISPLRTPTADFYRVDTALLVPRPALDAWRLRVTGLVDRPFELSWAELLDEPLVERDITLTCVSNEVGGPYCGSTRWLGVPVAGLLRRARPQASADQVLSSSVDGFTASTPLAVLLDGRDAMIAVAMDGAALTPEHGYPARLLTPGLYGYVGATKWLTELKVTTFAADEAYWTARGWAEQAPVKTACRIDTPRSSLSAGPAVIGGVAWATHRGVGRVEVQIDGGAWQPARLGPDVGLDYWRQWFLPWAATPGNHRLAARAYDAAGLPQTAEVQGVLPDGATGYHTIAVSVS